MNRNRYCSFQNYIQLFIAEPKSKELCNAVLYQRWKIRLEIQLFWRLIYSHDIHWVMNPDKAIEPLFQLILEDSTLGYKPLLISVIVNK